MTFNVTVPNAAQSPSLFPPQNNDNYQRLRDIINADHNFLNTASASQGIHKQCTMINRATPSSIPAGNGIFYSKIDSLSGLSELFWYNGGDNQITGRQSIRVESASITSGGFSIIAAASIPYPYYINLFVARKNDSRSAYWYAFYWSDSFNTTKLIEETNSGESFNLVYVGGELRLYNLGGSTASVSIAITTIRLPVPP